MALLEFEPKALCAQASTVSLNMSLPPFYFYLEVGAH